MCRTINDGDKIGTILHPNHLWRLTHATHIKSDIKYAQLFVCVERRKLVELGFFCWPQLFWNRAESARKTRAKRTHASRGQWDESARYDDIINQRQFAPFFLALFRFSGAERSAECVRPSCVYAYSGMATSMCALVNALEYVNCERMCYALSPSSLSSASASSSMSCGGGSSGFSTTAFCADPLAQCERECGTSSRSCSSIAAIIKMICESRECRVAKNI